MLEAALDRRRHRGAIWIDKAAVRAAFGKIASSLVENVIVPAKAPTSAAIFLQKADWLRR